MGQYGKLSQNHNGQALLGWAVQVFHYAIQLLIPMHVYWIMWTGNWIQPGKRPQPTSTPMHVEFILSTSSNPCSLIINYLLKQKQTQVIRC